jgi:hypothetical protein
MTPQPPPGYKLDDPTPAPPPGYTLDPPQQSGGFWHEAVVNPARQVASGALGAAAGANKLTANTFDLLDKAAEHISKATGTEKGGVFRAIADYTRKQQAEQERKAQELSGGRQDFTSQLYRGATQGLAELPQYAVAGEVMGPVAGVGAVSALGEADKGPVEALKAGVQGALTGGAMKVLGPGSRLLRGGTMAAGTGAQALLEGADPATALARATTMGGMSAMGPGGKTLKEAVRDEVVQAGGRRVAKLASKVAGGALNPVEQEAVDWAKGEGNIPLSPGTTTGNKFIQAQEALTQNRPFGAFTGATFRRGTESALQQRAGALTEQAHPEPVTPESAGRSVSAQLEKKAGTAADELAIQAHPELATPESVGTAIPAKLQKTIQNLSFERDAAYDKAWQGRDDPQHTYEMQVGTRRTPYLDEQGRETGEFEDRPVTKKVNMPVDVRDIKEQARPIFDEMQWMPMAERSASKAYSALERILKSDDFIPAWQAEKGLSGLKDAARTKTQSGVRDTGQGVAASLIKNLQSGIDEAVANTGQDAIEGLQKGRATHARVMGVADLADQLRAEPVQNFGKLTWQGDTGVNFLRQIQQQAPEQMAPLSRALLQQMLNKGAGARSAWNALGPETKQILFPDADLRARIENHLDVADVSRQLADNKPVQNFGRLVGQQDTNIDFLRAVKEQAPDEMPRVGRAWLQQQMDRGMREGGFSKTMGLLNDWRQLGPETKAILFPDAKLRTSLDSFFKVADMASHAPNPSGTALVQGADTWDPRKLIKGYIGSKLFFTPEGIKLLTDAIKPQSPGSQALNMAKVKATAARGGTEPPEEPPPPGTPPEEPPPTGGGGRPGTPPAASALDNPRNAYQYTTPEGIPVYKAPTPPGGSPAEPARGPLSSALQEARQRNVERVAANRAKLTGTPKPAETPAPEPGILEAYPERAVDEETPEGSATEVSVPGSGRSYQGQYEIRELDDLQASHNGKTFQPNPKYPLRNDRDYTRAANQGKVVQWSAPGEFDPRYLVNDNPDASNGAPVVDADGNVLGGNGRKMILDRVFSGDSKGTKAYTDLLNQKAAQFGIDPETVRGMRKPVLVRVVDNEALPTPAAKQDAITDFNKSGTASLRPSEKALADSRRVSPETLDNLGSRLEAKGPDATLADALEGTSGTQVLDRLIDDGVVSPQERAEYVDGPNLTQDGKARISRLMLGRFFEDPSQLDRTPLSIRAKLARVAAPLAQVEGKGEWSLAEPMHQALNLIEAAGGHGLTLNDYLQQGGLFTKQEYGPQAVTLAKRLQNMTQLQLTQAARQYAQDAQFAGHGEGLFGKPPSPDEAFQTAFGVKGLPQEAGTSGAAAMRKAQERNAGKVAARKAKLTGHSDETGTK